MKLENLSGEIPDFRRTVVKFWSFPVENALEPDQVDCEGLPTLLARRKLPQSQKPCFLLSTTISEPFAGWYRHLEPQIRKIDSDLRNMFGG